jgi:hypothetical protein
MSLVQSVTGPEPGTLDWYAQEAQQNGLTVETFFAGVTEYVQPASWDAVLAQYSLIVVEPLESRSYPTFRDHSIETWYRFRIVETLSSRPLSRSLRPPPGDFLPTQANEIVLYKYGGTLVRNGIVLTAIDPEYPQFSFTSPPTRYLLAAEINSATGTASLLMGQFGVFTIDGSGTLTPLNPDNPFQQDISSRYGNSLDQLRAALNGTPAPTPSPTPSCHPSNLTLTRCRQYGGSWDWEGCFCDYY